VLALRLEEEMDTSWIALRMTEAVLVYMVCMFARHERAAALGAFGTVQPLGDHTVQLESGRPLPFHKRAKVLQRLLRVVC
jgi:hypothetical protein